MEYTDIKLTQETKFKIARLHDNQLELIKLLSSLLIPNATYKTNSFRPSLLTSIIAALITDHIN